jgi:predicted transcriptional regulator
MANKITKRDVINMMLAEAIVKANPTYVAYLENELALLDKKATNKKATKVQEANVGLKQVILDVLACGKAMTVTEIMGANDELKGLSNQKVSALVKQLTDAGLVNKATDKKKSVFTLAKVEAETDVE